MATTPRYDIRTPTGVELWRCITLADAARLIRTNRAQPTLFPEWRGDLVAHPVSERRIWKGSASASPEAETTIDPLEELRYCGGDLGMTNIEPTCVVRTPTRKAEISLEKALRHLDAFEPKTRARLVRDTESWFDCKLDRGGA